MKNNILNLQSTSYKGILFRAKQPNGHQRKIMVTAKQLYNLVAPSCAYAEFCDLYIESTPLRLNIDYHYTDNFKAINLTLSAVQAVLVQVNTNTSWALFNEMSDLINTGFSTN